MVLIVSICLPGLRCYKHPISNRSKMPKISQHPQNRNLSEEPGKDVRLPRKQSSQNNPFFSPFVHVFPSIPSPFRQSLNTICLHSDQNLSKTLQKANDILLPLPHIRRERQSLLHLGSV